MPDFRSYAPGAPLDAREIVLSADESNHLVRVHRARAGDPVVVFNGRGTEWDCECADTDRHAARLRVLQRREAPARTAEIYLGQALPKGKTLDAIVRKATELGAAGLFPLTTERTEVHLGEERRETKREKWEAAAVEAAKQSGNAFLPAIEEVQPLLRFLAGADRFDLKLVGSLHPGAKPLKEILATAGPVSRAVWLIGPEGDFSPAEMEAALSAGFQPVTFGNTVLRCETAALFALSILTYELQNG
jgi:16S rRNA (uracil1498-N3)-methyltransferase